MFGGARTVTSMIATLIDETMNDPTPDIVQEVLRPLGSLISKSEKALQKLSPGTWQHAMLSKNIKALHIESALMDNDAGNRKAVTRDDLHEETLHEAMDALADMVNRTE